MLPGYPIKLTPNSGTKRRLALLGVAAACLLPNSLLAAKVHAETAEAGLRGQSRFLALAAEQSLQARQPDTALLLSLNALPGTYGGDRPLVPEAQVALNRAVHASTRTKQVEVQEDPLFAVISPGGTLVAVVPEEADVIEVYNVTTGVQVLEAAHDGLVEHAAFAPDDGLLGTLGEDGLRLWDLTENREVAHFDGQVEDTDAAPALEISNEQPLSAIFESLSAQAVDLPQLNSAGNRDPQLPLVAFSPDGATVAFAAEGGRLEVRRLTDQKRLHHVEINPKFLYFDDDADRIMVVDRDDDQLKTLAMDTGTIEQMTDGVTTAARTLSGADDIKLGGVEDGHLILFNAAGERTTEIRTKSLWGSNKDDADASGSLRDSTLISAGPGVVAGGTMAGVLVWDPEKTTQLEHFRGNIISSLSVSQNGEYLLAGTSTGDVQLYDTDAFGSLWAEAKSWDFARHTDRVVFVGFAGDDTTVSLAADRTLTFRQLPARKTELKDWGLERNPTAVLSPDGRWVSRYNQRTSTLNVWDVQTGEKRLSSERRAQPLSRTSFHPQNAQILASSPMANVLGEDQPAAAAIDFEQDTAVPATDGRPTSVDRSVYVEGGRLVITAATERKPSFSIWEAASGRQLQHIEGETLLAGSWLGSRLLTRSDRTLILHDLKAESSVTLHELPTTVDVEDLAAEFDDNGTRVLIRTGKRLDLWDTSKLKVIDSRLGSTEPTHFGLSADRSRWFAVVDGTLTLRQDGQNVDQIEVDEKNLLFALVDDRIVTVTLRGSLLQIAVPDKVSAEAAIANLPADRSCLTPEERDAYDLPSLTKRQWRKRGCPQFASQPDA